MIIYYLFIYLQLLIYLHPYNYLCDTIMYINRQSCAPLARLIGRSSTGVHTINCSATIVCHRTLKAAGMSSSLYLTSFDYQYKLFCLAQILLCLFR